MKQQAGNATNGRLIARLAGLGLAGLLFSSTAARAGLTAATPGAPEILAALEYQPPGGTVVAQTSTPFTATYQPNGTFVNFDGAATGQFGQQVLRDPTTGQLTFGYSIQLKKNAFRPVGPAATGTTAVTVPLPPAVYTGIGIMMACGIIGLFRKVMGG